MTDEYTTYSTELARVAQKEFEKCIKRSLPKFRTHGTREIWIDNLHMIISINWPRLREVIAKRDKYTCQDCKKSITPPEQYMGNNDFEVHHIIPRSKGGSDNPLNLKTLCKRCHNKYTKHLANFKSGYDKEQMKLC